MNAPDLEWPIRALVTPADEVDDDLGIGDVEVRLELTR